MDELIGLLFVFLGGLIDGLTDIDFSNIFRRRKRRER